MDLLAGRTRGLHTRLLRHNGRTARYQSRGSGDQQRLWRIERGYRTRANGHVAGVCRCAVPQRSLGRPIRRAEHHPRVRGGTALACASIAVSPSFETFAAGAVVLGGVAGLHFSVATSLLTRILSRIGSAIGIHTAGAPLAGLAVPMVAGAVGAWLGWRWALALGAGIAIPTAVLFAVVVRPAAPARPNASVWGRVRPDPIVELLARPPIALTASLSVLGAFVWQGTASFLPAFLIEHHGYGTARAGTLFSFYFAVQGFAQPALGALSDRLGRYPVAALAVGTGVAGYVALVVATEHWAIVGAVASTGLAMSWGAALLPAFMDYLGDDERSAGFGLIRTAYMMLGAGGSLAVGAAADVFGWGIAFLGLAGILALMLGTLLYDILRRRSHTAAATK